MDKTPARDLKLILGNDPCLPIVEMQEALNALWRNPRTRKEIIYPDASKRKNRSVHSDL